MPAGEPHLRPRSLGLGIACSLVVLSYDHPIFLFFWLFFVFWYVIISKPGVYNVFVLWGPQSQSLVVQGFRLGAGL
jgi:hypothetical protein